MGVNLGMAIKMCETVGLFPFRLLKGKVHCLLVKRIRHCRVDLSCHGKLYSLFHGKKGAQTGAAVDLAQLQL